MNIVIKFSASWCKPCSILQKQINDQIIDPDVCIFEFYDIDEYPELAKEYNIMSLPTLVKLNESLVEISRKTGNMSTSQLLEFCNG
jgi:thioredoxin 1